MKVDIKKQLEKEPKLWIAKLFVTAFIFSIIIWAGSTIEYKGVQDSGLSIAKNILLGIVSPDGKFLFDITTSGVMYLLLETVCIAFLGTIIGAIISVPLAFICSSNIVPKWLATIGTLIIAFIRTFPSFVYGLMFIRVTGPGAFAGVLTIAICSIGMITKMYIDCIADLDIKILESLDAAGCTTFQKIRYGILPQLSTDFVSTTIYRFEINIKDASILGLVGAGGIGAPLVFAMNSYKWNQVGSILVGLIILVLIVEFASTKIRKKLARG
ncbi:MAG: phosphonate ABC transporter, permease protein PhnE [Clostridium sp.]|uniref:phosphonate ABC transporter, permease protein PhnE n=1 Tax=Clostridium sp. DSM 8431 TaxID=1761781 RepID=UPI0008EFB597|nr:phosphonate ABC transporter, permease protein PhnE [Clostridium sp. DSM 8431]MCR4945183.1 phosphonate ABC transporter, permease protein PhnE [Clostridium sp.]SFU77783.1 phosphonate transport system permease protein [Clostridium sp. DSM 8431]